jgi:hypothetical protein
MSPALIFTPALPIKLYIEFNYYNNGSLPFDVFVIEAPDQWLYDWVRDNWG